MGAMRVSSKAMAYGALALSLAGCSTVSSALGGAIGGANRGVGDAAGNAAAGAVGGAVPAPSPGGPGSAGGPGGPGMGTYGPQMMMGYANMMFRIGFNSGGYWVSGSDLQPGQSVTFEFTSNNRTQRMERAFLTKLPDGKEWWRVKWFSMSDRPDTVVFEAMFSSDRSQVLRMRGKAPGQQAGEIPVQQNTGFTWQEPTYLTQESLDGATVGTESVSTPAGSFSAKHIRYNMMGGGTYEWWMATGVPGGVVKYIVGYGSNTYTQTLVAQGTNATTELGSY
jgi:hypothetical protein